MDRIVDLIQLEPAIITIGMCLLAWAFYEIFLRKVSHERRISLQKQYRNLSAHIVVFLAAFGGYLLIARMHEAPPVAIRIMPYLGLLTLIWGALVFVKASRLLLLQYLFFSHSTEGVPIVLVNTFTLCLIVIVYGWILKLVFNLQVAPLLAGSAIFSILLGLALQDTLGNLFSGIALQFDKAYDIGDWIEVSTAPTAAHAAKWIGKVYEISWRGTTLIGLSDEMIIIPNRVISQAQVANYSSPGRPILRRCVFRISHHSSIAKTREALVQAALAVPQVCRYPAPFTLVDETTESWVPIKLLYFVEDYGLQWTALDQVVAGALERLKSEGVEIAAQRFELTERSSKSEQ